MRYFEDLYTTYPRAYGELPSEAARQLAKVLKKGAKVVDIGCGYGRDSIYLAKEGFEVTGIDISRRGIMAAQLWAREKGMEVTFMNRDLMESKLPEKSFDCLLCVNTLEFLDARKRSKSGHAIWKRDFTGACSLFGAVLNTESENAMAAMLDGYRYFKIGASWGGYESLVIPAHPAGIRTAVPWTEKGYVLRYHIGLEDTEDLIEDLKDGFERLNQPSDNGS